MFSKDGRFLIILMAMIAVLLSGCNTHIGEAPPPPKAYEFSGTQCMATSIPKISAYLDGETTDQDITAVWDCFGSAVVKFKKYVRGSSEDKYTSQELADFIQDNFMNDGSVHKKISPALQVEVMKFKQIFVGGSRDYLTLQDLDLLVDLFQNFKTITLKLNPYMKVFAVRWKFNSAQLQTDVRYFEDANLAIQDVAKDLTSLVQKNHPSYNLNDFITLTRELSDLYDKTWFLEQVQQYMPLIQKVKKAISGGDEASITSSEWRSFILLGARGYVEFLRYHYFLSAEVQTTQNQKLLFVARIFEDGFSIFQDLVAEKPGGIVSKDDVSDLLKTFSTVWPTFRVSDPLITHFMKLKQLLVGGSVDKFEVKDFANARAKISNLQHLVDVNLMYFDVITNSWDPQSQSNAKDYFKRALESVVSSLQQLGLLLESNYDLADVSSLVHELAVLYPDKIHEDGTLLKIVDDYMPLVIDIKNMTYGQKDTLMYKQQWPSFFSFAARAYGLYLYENYFLKPVAFKSEVGLSTTIEIVDLSSDLFKDILKANSRAAFAQVDVLNLVNRVQQLNILPITLSPESTSLLVDVLLNRFLLSPELRLKGQIPQALNAQSIDVLRNEVLMWLELEKLNVVLFASPGSSYSHQQIRKIVADITKKGQGSPQFQTAVKELGLALNSSVPLTLNRSSFLVISNKLAQTYNSASLSQLSLDRVIARILIRSYANDLQRINAYVGITLPEAQKAFYELKPLAVSFGVIEPDNTTFADSRFREANIFVPRANGDAYLSFAEGVDIISMISSGLSLNSAMMPRLMSTCLSGNIKAKTVSIECLTNNYAKQMPTVMTSMPEFIGFMRGNTPESWSEFFGNVLKAAGVINPVDGKAKLSDVSLVPHVIQYIEMIFVRYDSDRSGYLDTKEALAAFPAFKQLIKQYANGAVADSDLDSVFTYILKHGKPPETILEKIDFVVGWKGHPDTWDLRADRAQIAKIFGYISVQAAGPQSATFPDLKDVGPK